MKPSRRHPQDAPSRINQLQNSREQGIVPRNDQMLERDRRRDRRFVMSHPVTITFRNGPPAYIAAVTRNVSTGGVLLQAEKPVLEGSEVEVRIAIPTGAQLVGSGVVVRTTKQNERAFGIAVRCDTPLDFA